MANQRAGLAKKVASVSVVCCIIAIMLPAQSGPHHVLAESDSQHLKLVVNDALKQPGLGSCLNTWFGTGTVLSNRNLPHLDEGKSSAQLAIIVGYTGSGDVVGTPKQPVSRSGRPTVYIASDLRGDKDEEIRTYIHEIGNVLAMQNYGADGAFRGPQGGPPSEAQQKQRSRRLDPDIGYQLEICVFGPPVVRIAPITITVTSKSPVAP